MFEKDWPSEEQEQTCYRTGFTQPKKTKRGFMAILLVLAIFLGGVSTTFRLLNIELFRNVTRDSAIAPASVQFSRKSRGMDHTPGLPSLGLTGQEISSFEHICYNIPLGFYITQVKSGSTAEIAGILPGDILLYFNGVRISNVDILKTALYAHSAGDKVTLFLYRQGGEFSVELYLDAAQ